MHQAGTSDPAWLRFIEALLWLRNVEVTEGDCHLFMTHTAGAAQKEW